MIYILLLFYCVVQETFCLGNVQLTVNVEPLKEDCFFQFLKANDLLELEYQVLGGGHGDLDISFNVVEPTGRILVADFKKSGKNHDITLETSGDYKFCFDNTFSSFNTKTVYFELFVDDLEDAWNGNTDISFDNSITPTDIKQIEGFYEVINTVRNHLTKARTLQDMIKLTEAKDRNIAEETNFKVNSYSTFVLIIMILVSFIQIVMVKSIFDEKSKLYKILCFLDIS